MYSKRKSNFLINQDDEEEDEWEREAFSSIKKQPNLFAIHVDILDEQYNTLSNTHHDLAEEFKELQAILQQLNQEEQDLTTSLEESKQEHLNSIEETISIIHTAIDEQQQDDSINTNTVYIAHDELLSKDLESFVEDWKKVLQLDQDEYYIEKKIKSLSHQYKFTEFEIIDSIAQINGFEARIQSLKRDTSKLNSLPQFIPILKSDIEKYKSEINNTTALLDKLEKNSIRPYLIKLAELKISLPLNEDTYFKKIQVINDLLDDIEQLFKIAIKQRACQQLVEYINNKSNTDSDTLQSYTSTMENHELLLEEEKVAPKQDEGQDEFYATELKKLLDQFFESKKDIALFTSIAKKDMTLVDQIHALKEYEMKLTNKWQEDFQSCLDAAKELNGLQSRLSQTLFIHSSSTDNLIMTPKPYANLQNELEYRTAELEASISELQKNVDDPNENALYDQQRKLFSAFFTDPEEFIDMFKKDCKRNNNHLAGNIYIPF